jgi:hypothetical protein
VIQEVGDDERLNLPLLVRESRERRKNYVLLIRKSENTNKVLTLLVKSRRAYIA